MRPRFSLLPSEEDIFFTTTSPEPLDSGEYQSRDVKISPTLVNGLGRGLPFSLAAVARLTPCSWGPGGRAGAAGPAIRPGRSRSEEHTSELQSLMRISYAVFCLKKKKHHRSQP